MCGHLTIFSRRDPPPEGALRRGLGQLGHRGPDAEHFWSRADGRVAMGHARLRIIDLTTGDQPLATEDGAIHAVVNGEFYDYERIRRELAARGHHFATAADSEILLHLWRERGADCLAELRGEFAFTLWDEMAATLFAARDRFGIKPLYYAWFGERLYLASEIKALFAAGVPARWDEPAVRQYHHALLLPPGRTLYENVRELPAGHYLCASGPGFRLGRYWDFGYPEGVADDAPRHLEESTGAVRVALQEAVRLRLRADVPVACYLSGGIDSCAILGLAAQCGPPPPVFTVAFDDPWYSEESVAREVAARVGAKFHPVPIGAAELAQSFRAALRHAETPFQNLHGVAKYRLSAAVRAAGYKVVLTGEGADEIFGGYPHILIDHTLRRASPKTDNSYGGLRLTGPSREMLASVLAREARRSRLVEVLGYLPYFLANNLHESRLLRSLLRVGAPLSADELDPLAALHAALDVPGQLARRAPAHQSLYLWAKTVLPGYILTVLGDRMEMAHGVEGRLPFLDHPLTEAVARLPVTASLCGTVQKHVLREAVRELVPEAVYRQHKRPFMAPPLADRATGPLHELLHDTLRGSALIQFPFYDRARVLALLDGLGGREQAQRAALDRTLMIVLSFVLLQEELLAAVA